MKALSLIAKRLKDTRNLFYYKKKYRQLKTEVESLKTYYNEKLHEMDLMAQYKSYELEKRLNELEEYRSRTEHILKIIDSLEPEVRKN